MPPDRKPRPGISRWIKGTLSAAIVWHFTSLFFAAVAPPMPGFAPSALLAGIYDRLFRTQLEFLGLNNPHRYYAPGIGPFSQAWFRAERVDGAVRWTQLPGPRNPWLPARCQRRLGIALALQSGTEALSGEPGTAVLTDGGRWLAAAYARHVAVVAGPVAEVQVYQVMHRIRAPEEVRRGWLATDLRLYAPRYLGTYFADGRAKVADENAPVRAPQIPMSVFAATILREDVWPALRGVPADGRRAALAPLQLPAPVVQLLENFPALAEPREPADPRERIVQAVQGRDLQTADAAEW